jgi:hypothetical protein
MKRVSVGVIALLGLLASSAAQAAPRITDDTLRDACPDGRIVRLTNTETGESVDLACEDARALLAPLEDELNATVDEISQNMTLLVDHLDAEQTGEARQAWSPLGLACDIIFGVALTYGCSKSKLTWGCFGAGLGPMVACNLL